MSRHPISPFLLGLVLSLAVSSGTAAQAYPYQSTTDSLLSSVDRVISVGELPPITSCAAIEKSVKRFCEGVIYMRRAELVRETDDASSARDLLERSVIDEPRAVAAWYALGRTRLQARRLGMVGREGPMQMVGESNDEGAARALERAVQLDPAYRPAWQALAIAPIAWQNQKAIKQRVLLLRKGRQYLGAAGLVGMALFELDGGSPDTAVVLLQRLLASDDEETPRGLAQITLARALYRIGRPQQGRSALFAGALATDSAGIATYKEQLSWVADSTEMKSWTALEPDARPAWLAAFWGTRDVRDGRKDGERLIEHYRRVNIAFATYRMTIPFTGQQRMLTHFGEPEFVRTVTDITRRLEKRGAYQPDTVRAVLEYLTARSSVGAQSSRRYFNSNQSVLDDRGLVFIRHGEPDKRAAAIPSSAQMPDPAGRMEVSPGGSAPRPANTPAPLRPLDLVSINPPGASLEVWRYDRPAPNPPLILYFISQPFQGSTEPTVLVPTLLAEDPGTRLRLCVIDPDLCPTMTTLGEEIVAGRMSIGRIAQASLAGKETITTAVTSDDYARPFAKTLHPATQINLLELAQGGSPRLVFAFALPGQELTARAGSNKSEIVYPVKIEMSAVRMSDGKRAERDTLREYAMPHALTKGEFLSGLMELRLGPGTWIASMAVTQAGGAGAIMLTKEIHVEEYATHLKVGDLVLGQDSAGLRWHSGPAGQPVPINPLNTYQPGSSLSIYSQISGLSERVPYRATFEIFEGIAAKGTAALTIGFDETPKAERMELSRVLSLKNLAPGRYLVRLTIQSGGQTVTSTGGLSIVK